MTPISLPISQIDKNAHENTKVPTEQVQNRISASMIQTVAIFTDIISEYF